MSEDIRLPPAYRLVARDEVDSTNDEARRLAEAGAEDGTLVWAKTQRKGRGRRGRDWASPPGNLYFSLVLRPECPPFEAAQLSFVAALGLAGALGSLCPPLSEVAFKWPNDVLLNDHKTAGILLESSTTEPVRLDWLVLGMGVNVTSAPEDTEFPATSLRAEGCDRVSAAAVLEAFARHFLVWVNRWLDDGFGPVREAWLREARGVGEAVTVRIAGETFTGTFVDLDADGALIVETVPGDRRVVTAGDLYFGGES
ncbi:MAG: biotin--[acetyl-CoA-carboxylase] ligase [Alphaproteobacteria bacterium]